MPHPPLESLVGKVVLNDVRLDALLCVDGDLATFLATSVSNNRSCTARIATALIVPPQRDSSVASAFSRIVRHCVGLPALARPHCAGAVELGDLRCLCIVHDRVSDTSAEDQIRAGAAFPLDPLVAMLRPVASALAALHAQGLVHGAVHPGAVHLQLSGAVLSAFGLSELAVVVGGAIGARDVIPPRSRSPEQVGTVPAAPVPESDTYAFAMVVCELLARRPFTDATDRESISRLIDHPITRPSPRNLSVDVPDYVENAFTAALRLQSRDRTTDPVAFLDAIAIPPAVQDFLDTQAPLTPSSSPPVPVDDDAPNDGSSAGRQRSGHGFQAPPPRKSRSRKFVSIFPRADEPDRIPTETSRRTKWIIGSLVGAGVSLLFFTAAAGFYTVFTHRALPSASTSVSSIAPKSKGPAPAPPTLRPDPAQEQAELDDPSADATAAPVDVDPAPSGPGRMAPMGLAPYAEDTSALIPILRDNPIVGSQDASVTVVAFADFRCPYTRRARMALEKLLDRYPSELRVVIKHRPLPLHADAPRIAELAATVHALGGTAAFWSFFKIMTENQAVSDEAKILGFAEQAGAPKGRVEQALRDHQYQFVVKADENLAGQVMVRATPTFFINGMRLDGMQSQAVLEERINSELAATKAARSSGTPTSKIYAKRVAFNLTSAAADPVRPGP